MRSKPLNRANAARARLDPVPAGRPGGSGPNRTSQVVTALVLLALGAVLALAVDRLVPPNGGARASASPSAAAEASGDLSSSPSDSSVADASVPPSAGPTDSPAPSPSPTAAILEGLLPKEVNGTTLTVTSAKGTTALGNGPTTRALAAAVVSLGQKAEDLELGYAYDSSSEVTMTILGFRLPGVEASKLEPVVLQALLVATTPGVKTTNITLSGTPATKVDYGDEAAFEYVFARGDSVFVIETSDETLAAAAVAAMPAAPAQPSPQPSAQGSPHPSASPSP